MYSYLQVKMIGQQAPRNGLCDGGNVPPVPFQEVPVILIAAEHFLASNCPVKQVIGAFRHQWDMILRHAAKLESTPKPIRF
jgi:hypothetical protein